MQVTGGLLPSHVLAVDDDPWMRDLITTYLSDNDLRVTAVPGEAAMLSVIDRERVDLVILDIALKGEDGMTIACNLRATSRLPIIMVTGRQDQADRVMALEIGADDYLTKPFSPRELLARIRALLRRIRMHEALAPQSNKTRAYRFEGWELDVRLRRLASPLGKFVHLRNGEFNLLLAFLSSPQRVMTREELLNLSRSNNVEIYDRSIDVQVGRLRRKIEGDASAPRLILTERSVGYIFQATVQMIQA